MNRDNPTAAQLADRIADHLADPVQVADRHHTPTYWRQSLASGALGIALVHVERARTGLAPWGRAETWLRYAASGALDNGPGSHLHYGVPALAFVLNHAARARPSRYARALDQLDEHITAITTGRVDTAQRRIDSATAPALAEFDAIRGLTGLGAYWLAREAPAEPLRAVLTYLVRLTEPHPDGTPGWWTHLGPDGRRTAEFPRGHSNHGIAHGVAGPLALLALSYRRGVCVPGHSDALRRILAWLDHHQHDDDAGTWWPYWATPNPATPPHRGRPSWCYGAAGIARTQQLAGLALGDDSRIQHAETALHAVLIDRDLLHQLDDAGLCHGSTGTLTIARRAAHDSPHELLPDVVPALRTRVESDPHVLGAADAGRQPDLLNGAAGIALALGDLHDDATPGWDTCLLTS